MTSTQSLMFKVHRPEPELVPPAKPTPHEFKPLSDIDSLDPARCHVPMIQLYPHNPSMNGVDPVRVIRKAVAQTLVFYYPFAGRLRESPTGKFIVECTGEGVLFIEADAEATLHQFGYPLLPPFPCFDQLLFDVPGSSEFLNCPLLLIQVTRLKCGGFVLGLRCNHMMCDGTGLAQFMSAIGEMARGATSPSVLPTWERHMLYINNPPQVERDKNDVSDSTDDLISHAHHDLCYRAFFFGPTEISALRRLLPHDLQHCTSFEIVTASVWKCRVVALEPHPTQEVNVIWAVSLGNSKLKYLIPDGYYGNALVLLMAKSTTKEIRENPLSYAIQLIRNGNDKVNEDRVRSPKYFKPSMWSYSVSDLRHAGFENVDFGWGKAAYGGLSYCGPTFGYHVPFKHKNGENGMMLPLCLPTQAMERFGKELNNMFKMGDESAIKSNL